jgi:hypothetical protein
MVLYCMLNYLILIRILLGPCLRDYVQSMWPTLWISGLMAGVVMLPDMLVHSIPVHVKLLLQVLFGVATYLGLMLFTQRKVLVEIRSVICGKLIS